MYSNSAISIPVSPFNASFYYKGGEIHVCVCPLQQTNAFMLLSEGRALKLPFKGISFLPRPNGTQILPIVCSTCDTKLSFAVLRTIQHRARHTIYCQPFLQFPFTITIKRQILLMRIVITL